MSFLSEITFLYNLLEKIPAAPNMLQKSNGEHFSVF
jgi:hypothetical protein